MKKIIVSWIGQTDLNAISEKDLDGPVLSALKAEAYDHIYLISNYPKSKTNPFLNWIRAQGDFNIDASYAELESPINFGDIYKAANHLLYQIHQGHQNLQLTINLSPGTPAMAAVWILLGKTKYNASFIQTSREKGVQREEIPFDITAEFLPGMLKSADKNLSLLIQSNAPEAPEFKEIITQNPKVLKEIKKAKQLALYPTPVLIQGESGTGKTELDLFFNSLSQKAFRGEL